MIKIATFSLVIASYIPFALASYFGIELLKYAGLI